MGPLPGILSREPFGDSTKSMIPKGCPGHWVEVIAQRLQLMGVQREVKA